MLLVKYESNATGITAIYKLNNDQNLNSFIKQDVSSPEFK